jgi:hypothetical protein
MLYPKPVKINAPKVAVNSRCKSGKEWIYRFKVNGEYLCGVWLIRFPASKGYAGWFTLNGPDWTHAITSLEEARRYIADHCYAQADTTGSQLPRLLQEEP